MGKKIVASTATNKNSCIAAAVLVRYNAGEIEMSRKTRHLLVQMS